MKSYKRLCLAIMALVLLVALSGCIMIPVSKYYDIPAEDVVSVQFYDLRNVGSGRVRGFDKKHDPVYTLPAQDNEAFLKEFSKLKFSDTIIIVLASVDPSFNYGDWVVRINFTNGRYTFYSCSGYGETYDAEGECISTSHYGCEDEDLERLIGQFYPLQQP